MYTVEKPFGGQLVIFQGAVHRKFSYIIITLDLLGVGCLKISP